MKKTFLLSSAAVLATALMAAAQDLPEVDVSQLQAQASEYRHRADVLRRMIGARERQIGQTQQQADALVRQAQADAQARQAQAAEAAGNAQNTATALNLFSSFIPGGDSLAGSMMKSAYTGVANGMVNQAGAQVQQANAEGAAMVGGAHSDADTLMAQAEQLQGEKKKLAYKAKQYEQLADSKDLEAAGEVLRRRADNAVHNSSEIDKEIAAERAFVQGLTPW